MYQPRLPRRRRRQSLLTAIVGGTALLLPVAIVVTVVLVSRSGKHVPARAPATAIARPRTLLESIFQDDDHLLGGTAASVAATLDTLKAIGADRVRVTVLWKAIAPAPVAAAPPRGFSASDPAAYPAAAWAPYDRLVTLAAARGLGVDFNVTAPGPRWAMRGLRGVPAKFLDHYAPTAAEFGAFVNAVGQRYSGRYRAAGTGVATLPRVSFWTIWNEPNQPGWLAPQRASVNGHELPAAPAVYRALLDAAFAALIRTGHGPSADTVLTGELAPEGSEAPGAESPLAPMTFLRSLYCLDDAYHPLTGAAALAVGCPLLGQPATFARLHPSLFDQTGWAHHPYSFFLAPQVSLPDPNFVPLADLGRLEQGLDRIFAHYGQTRRLPLYLTEYGYETNPPDPFRGVSLREQSLYLNESVYLASLDPRVRSSAQFLLVDAVPDRRYRPGTMGYWSTFQTGLETAAGRPKLSLNSYRVPIYLPDTRLVTGRRTLIWGMLRLAPNATRQQARIEWRPEHGRYRTLSTVSTEDPSGIVSARLALPGPGAVRIEWFAPDGSSHRSRSVGVG